MTFVQLKRLLIFIFAFFNEIFQTKCLNFPSTALMTFLKLVNRLWCEVAVRILWRNVLNYSPKTISTLINIACLPNRSKEILLMSGIIISIPTSKPPTFNYASTIDFVTKSKQS